METATKFDYTLLSGELTTILAANKHEDDSDLEGEYFTYLDELLGLVSIPIDNEHREEIQQFIDAFCWENFRDEEDESKFFSLGSMYFNKLQWIAEMSKVNDFVTFALTYSDIVVSHLDKLEHFATGKHNWKTY